MFAATNSPTVPLPLPVWPDWIAIQFAALDALHAHPASVATSTDNRPPSAPIVSRDRLRSNRQTAAAWLTGTRSSPTTIPHDLAEGTALAATVNAIVPSPCPLVVASDTHPPSAEADHAQSRVVETEIDPVPPFAGNVDEG